MKLHNKPNKLRPSYGDKIDVIWRNNAGQLHRIGGPAIENESGACYYFVNGERHREDGPACINRNGTVEYWQFGKLHRIGGPAITCNSSLEHYYISGRCVSKEGHDLLFDIMKIKGLI